MSEIGIISKQHDQLVITIDETNLSVIMLKKAFLAESGTGQYSHFAIGDDERGQAITQLGEFIEYLVNLFDKRDEPDYRFIPEKVLDKFRGNIESEAEVKSQLKGVLKLIRNGKLPSGEQFELLDRIVTILDMERNKLSKKIRLARG
jgi:hypothetical protein